MWHPDKVNEADEANKAKADETNAEADVTDGAIVAD